MNLSNILVLGISSIFPRDIKNNIIINIPHFVIHTTYHQCDIFLHRFLFLFHTRQNSIHATEPSVKNAINILCKFSDRIPSSARHRTSIYLTIYLVVDDHHCIVPTRSVLALQPLLLVLDLEVKQQYIIMKLMQLLPCSGFLELGSCHFFTEH